MFDLIAYTLALRKAKAYTNSCFQQFPMGLVYRGAVNYYDDLPLNAEVGDTYTVKYIGSSGSSPDGREYAWGNYDDVNQWILISGITDIKNADGTSLVTDGVASIPKANSETFGVVKPDGNTITTDENGIIHGVEHTVNSEDGVHNLRYYNGVLQYDDNGVWTNISISDLMI